MMRTVQYHGKKYRVPVEDDGLVPTSYLQSIQEKRTKRSKTIDAKKRATTTFPSKPQPIQAVVWKLHPGKYDIDGIDTPIVVPVNDVEINEPPKEVSAPKRSVKKKSVGKGYSSSTWKKRVNFDEDPINASKEAMKLLRVEEMDVTEDMRAYLDDTDYDEIAGSRYRHDDRELANRFYEKMWNDYKTYEEPLYYNKKPRGRK